MATNITVEVEGPDGKRLPDGGIPLSDSQINWLAELLSKVVFKQPARKTV
jgi:hypothetical protein